MKFSKRKDIHHNQMIYDFQKDELLAEVASLKEGDKVTFRI